jgi:hypothetical protein
LSEFSQLLSLLQNYFDICTVRFSVYGTVLYHVGTCTYCRKTGCKHRLFTFTLHGNNSDCPLFTCIFNGNLFSFSGWPAGTLFPFPHCAASSHSFLFHFRFSVSGEQFILSTLACFSCPLCLVHLFSPRFADPDPHFDPHNFWKQDRDLH